MNFCIKCNNRKEFKQVQLLLFKLNHEWLDSEKDIFFPKNETYPLFITNHTIDYKFIWQKDKDENIKYINAKNYLRKFKLEKLWNLMSATQ